MVQIQPKIWIRFSQETQMLKPTWHEGSSIFTQTALRILIVKNGTQQIRNIPENIGD